MVELSVITINFNDAAGLERTIQSVAGQSFRDREYIVVDGGSTDGSTEVIKKYAASIDRWVSEKDKGIYNAQNKGLAMASGRYCLFLNSGDLLRESTVLEKVFREKQDADIVYGNMCIDWGNGNMTHGKMPDRITKEQLYIDTLWHPVSFIKRSLFERYGNYDESYRMVADYEFFFRTIIAHGATTKHVDVEVSTYNVNGFSSRPEFKKIEKAERAKVQQTYLSPEEILQLEKKFEGSAAPESWIKKISNKLKKN